MGAPPISSAGQALRRLAAGACLLAGLALAWGAPARAEEPVAAVGTVTRVVVEGNRRIEEAVVLAATDLRRGEQLSADKVRRDLQAVFDTGYFDDVVVNLVDDPGGAGVEVHFVVKEKPAVREVRLVGQKKVDDDDLNEVLDVHPFSVLNESEVKEAVGKLREVYVDKGFYLVDIEPTYEPVGNDQVDVVFNIVENRKVVVQRIEFSGNEHVPAKKIRRYLQTREAGFLPFLGKAGTFKRDALDADQNLVLQVYLEEGYLDVKVEPPKVYLSPDKKYIFVHYDVTEGPKYTVGAVDVDGDFVEEEGLTREAATQIIGGRQVADVQDEQWRYAEGKPRRLLRLESKGPHLETGETYQHSVMYQVKSSLESLWQDQGYAFVNVVPDLRPDPATHVAAISYRIDKGEKVRIGRINITGNDPTFDKVVRREIPIAEGDIYRGSLQRAARQRLMRLGYFEDVTISTPRGEGDGVLDMNVQVSERPTGSFSLGLGYSNLESLVLNGSIQRSNFLGLGYQMQAAINWSRLRKQGNLSLFDPYFLDSRWTASIDAFLLSQQFQVQNNEYRRGGSLRIGRYLDARNDTLLQFEYTIEDVGLVQVDAYRLALYGGDLYKNGLTSQIGAVLSVDKRNDRILPTRGLLTNLKVAWAGGFRLNEEEVLSVFGGDFNFLETTYNFRMYRPLLPKTDRVRFQMNVTLGNLTSTDGREIAFIHRYRAGGINSLRGFQWFSLGPSIRVPASDDPLRADEKLIVGGTQTWTNNFEIESLIVPQAGISTVVFFDAGNAFRGPGGIDPISPFALRTAVGAGVRWQSPIGPLRFELGVPLQPQPGERKSVFDFGIGRFF